MSAPIVVKVIEEKGQINDELDYALMNYILRNRGTGFTACQPQLVELEGGKQAIKMSLDNTFIGKNNQLLGLGIVGSLFIDVDTLKVLYCFWTGTGTCPYHVYNHCSKSKSAPATVLRLFNLRQIRDLFSQFLAVHSRFADNPFSLQPQV